jgi:DNA-binding MarR family transcriptional regulator
MNNFHAKTPNSLLTYQSQRLQDLMREILQCCQERMLFESHKFGLPQAELKCLMLFEMERYLTVKGIAQKMEVAKSRVTKIMDGLTKKRLIQSTEDPNDGRVKLLSLTPAGQKKLTEIDAFLREIHQKILDQLESGQRKVVLSSLELLRSSMEAVKAQLK